jgi:fructosamine-3-kinase
MNGWPTPVSKEPNPPPVRRKGRHDIYYWKCDRSDFLHGTREQGHGRGRPGLIELLREALANHFSEPIGELRVADSPGNHLAFLVTIGTRDCFVRVEDGPEQDDYMEVESRVMAEVAQTGVPTPVIHCVDSSRKHVPFAWQVMERVPCPNLNQLLKQNRLVLGPTMEKIGAFVARWQDITPNGFGLFDPHALRDQNRLVGWHETYEAYFRTRLSEHLAYLAEQQFISGATVREIEAAVDRHAAQLALPRACLVHKDLALWNVLGTESEITAVIDWDDSIGGDPMDDLSLLGCFFGGEVLAQAFRGYASRRPLPEDYRSRFWLHLLRNMVVKAVIRMGAGYFSLTDSLFLIGPGGSGAELQEFTFDRLTTALRGLNDNADPLDL